MSEILIWLRLLAQAKVGASPKKMWSTISARASGIQRAAPTALLRQKYTARGERVERRVAMTRMRSRIAERLLRRDSDYCIMTTFNEVDMTALMDLRKQYKEEFTKIHNGTRLGFMGFFVKAAVEALKRFPSVNASIDGSDIVYHGYQDVGVAVSTDRGLVVPVLRNAENMSIATVENGIYDYA